jgi:polyphosphate glucokinase
VPNLQLAHHPAWRKKTFEEELGDKELKQEGRRKWNKRLERAIRDLASLFNYDTLYLGGGNSANVRLKLPRNVRIVSNVAGLLGGIALWRD